jgi:hypothetical protein
MSEKQDTFGAILNLMHNLRLTFKIAEVKTLDFI